MQLESHMFVFYVIEGVEYCWFYRKSKQGCAAFLLLDLFYSVHNFLNTYIKRVVKRMKYYLSQYQFETPRVKTDCTKNRIKTNEIL